MTNCWRIFPGNTAEFVIDENQNNGVSLHLQHDTSLLVD